MKNIPTAREIFKKYSNKANRVQDMNFNEMMIEFAKLHVEACKKEIKNRIYMDENYICMDETINCMFLSDKDSILNAYPLENIK